MGKPLDKHEIRVLDKFNSLISLKVDQELTHNYLMQNIDLLNFGKGCFSLPNNVESHKCQYFTNDILLRLIGMIKRGELILKESVNKEEIHRDGGITL